MARRPRLLLVRLVEYPDSSTHQILSGTPLS